MIFESYNNTADYDPEVAPSQYTLGIEGALMHVYESQCNYNALMEAAGIAEYNYAIETGGGDLFVNEAGAFSNFLSRAKEMFKKILEKIKAIFNKLGMVLAQYTKTDKEFVNKYGKQLRRVNMRDFEFKGYTFKDLNAAVTKYSASADFIAIADGAIKDSSNNPITVNDSATWSGFVKPAADIDKTKNDDEYYIFKDSDKLTDAKEKARANFKPTSSSTTSYDSISELLEDWKEELYGSDEKEILDDKDINMIQQLSFITDTKQNTKDVNKAEKEVTKHINRIIKMLERLEKEAVKLDKEAADKDVDDKMRRVASKNINDYISLLHSISADATAVFGAIVQAVKDRNRQAKAICIKALNYKPKNESAYYSDDEYYGSDDIFGGVTLR